MDKFEKSRIFVPCDNWRQPFVLEGRQISWEDALGKMVDRTGRPGPATWEVGGPPPGEEDYPVRGVSWYEAAAFAEFAGKSLPSIHHWIGATDELAPPALLTLSNFDGKGAARVGSHQGLGPYGTYDMAGNVKEWCQNASGEKRYILGGAWDEPVYMYQMRHAQPPFERRENYGFRCARYVTPPASALTAPVETVWRDYSRVKPVDDATFAVFRSLYAYDRASLDSTTETIASGSPHWREQKITMNAAYGGERLIAYLFLPTDATPPPYQTVVYFPGADALELPRLLEPELGFFDFVIRSGRAVLQPIYKGTYERRLRQLPQWPSRAYRDLVVQQLKDLGRSVDYLETRTDIDAAKLAYYGFSWGANVGPRVTSLDRRFKASILLAGGLGGEDPGIPEIDVVNFAPHVTTPTLMLNGRYDFFRPLEQSQVPMFRLLGPNAKDKQHVLFDGGHIPPRMTLIKAALDWLDRYLGPVATTH